MSTTDSQGILHGLKRSPEWPKVEKAFLKKNPACIVCGKTEAVQVHHVIPFELLYNIGHPEWETDERNLVGLCETESGRPEENHHLEVGHGGDFKKTNLHVREDAIKFKGFTLEQLKESVEFLADLKANVLPPIDQITHEHLYALKELGEKLYPKL